MDLLVSDTKTALLLLYFENSKQTRSKGLCIGTVKYSLFVTWSKGFVHRYGEVFIV